MRETSDPSGDTRRFFFVAPTFGSQPSTGVTAGVSADLAAYLGDARSTHISSMSAGLKVSVKNQVLGSVRFRAFSNRDRWLFQGDDRLWRTSEDTFGLGGGTPSSALDNVKYNHMRVFQTVSRNIASNLFLGVGLDLSDISDVRPGTGPSSDWSTSAYVTYTQAHGFALAGQRSSGPSVAVSYDTRDNQINAYEGVLASVSYRTFVDGFLGGDSDWQELYIDARTYQPLTRDARHRLAFWFVGDLVTRGAAPYFDLPSTGTPDRLGRGYADGRYRGEHLLYGEVEYRGSLTRSGLLGVVAFFNLTTIDNVQSGERLFESFAPGGGAGLRVLLNKRTRSNFCMDYGWGKDGSRGFYLYIQEAF